MLFYGHILLGLLVFLISRNYFSGGNEIIFFLLVMLGSLLPDIDEENSKISKWFGIIGKIVSKIFSHRGFLHSIFFFLILGMLMTHFFGKYYAYGLMLGYLAHLLGDAISLQGVKVFHPLQFKVRGPMKVGGVMEVFLTGFLLVVIVMVVFF